MNPGRANRRGISIAIGWMLLFGYAFACPASAVPFQEDSGQSRADDSKSESARQRSAARRSAAEGSYVQIPQVLKINELIEAGWSDHQIRPSDPAADGEWLRRLCLDVLGRIPSVEERDRFLADKSPRKREEWVDRLLADDEFVDDYTRNWTTVWTNLLIGRTGGNDQNSLISREGMQKYLRDSFARNKPYDKMVYELVTATGTTAPGTAKFNGATNYLIDKIAEDNAAQATAATSRIFLGLQVQCTQCHNHPFNDWKQQKYWEMNAFFRQTRALRNSAATGGALGPELIDQDFAGESGDPEEADAFYELRNGLVKVAFPVFVDGHAIDKSGYLREVNRREALGKLMIESPYLAQAMVNRTWAHFLGYGFTKPLDDLGPHNPASHPELLEYLAAEFRESGYDVRELVRWIVLSRPYGLSSEGNPTNAQDDPLLGETPKFSRFYLRQMTAEQLYESLAKATAAEQSSGTYEERERQKNQWLQQFSRTFGTDEGDESTSFNGTIPQVLMMFNGEMIRVATGSGRQTFLEQVAAGPGSQKDKLDRLFQAGLSRSATSAEIRLANQLLAARGGDILETLRDVWWVVLNSNEFIFNH